jgi:O-antigen ligase
MKYAIFFMALLGVPPLAVILSLNKSLAKYAVWAMVGALAAYQSTSINFFSNETYRGSARGMEVSLAYLMALALVILGAVKGRLRLVPSAGTWIFIAYFLLCLPSLATAENLLFSWFEIWKMIMMYLTYLSVRAYLDVTGDVKSLLKGLAAFAVWNLLLIAKAHVSGVYQPDGSFAHQNCLAMAMLLFANLFFAVYMSEGWRGSWLYAAAFVAASGCVVRTYSRGAIAMLPVSFSVTFALTFLFAAKSSRGRVLSRIAPVALAGLVGVAAIMPRVLERFQTASAESANTRVELALCAREMILDEPLRGVGINNWGLKINYPYDYAERAGRFTNRGEDFADGVVETVYLLVGAECGLPALAAMVVWFLFYLFRCVRLSARLSGTLYAAIGAGLAGGLVANYLQSFLEWVLRQQMNLIILMVFFALVDYIHANARRLKAEEGERNAL